MILTYEFECEKCEHIFEKKRDRDKISGYKPTCPQCKSRKTFQVLSFHAAIRQEPNTVGWLAERNTEEMSPELLKLRREDFADNGRKAKRVLLEESGKIPRGMKIPDEVEHDPWYGKLPNKVKKNINSPTETKNEKKDQTQKVTDYIMKGT